MYTYNILIYDTAILAERVMSMQKQLLSVNQQNVKYYIKKQQVENCNKRHNQER